MTEREAVLCAICAHPDDDTPRLVLADWFRYFDRIEVIVEHLLSGGRAQLQVESYLNYPRPERLKCLHLVVVGFARAAADLRRPFGAERRPRLARPGLTRATAASRAAAGRVPVPWAVASFR